MRAAVHGSYQYVEDMAARANITKSGMLANAPDMAVVSCTTPTTPADVNRCGMSGDFRESAPAPPHHLINRLVMMLVNIVKMLLLDRLGSLGKLGPRTRMSVCFI